MSKFEVGGYAYYSWGYDQTNIDWFKVVRKNEKSVWFQAVKAVKDYSSSMSGNSVPNQEQEPYGEVFRKSLKVSPWQGEHEVCVHRFGNIYPWEGKPKFFSEWA